LYTSSLYKLKGRSRSANAPSQVKLRCREISRASAGMSRIMGLPKSSYQRNVMIVTVLSHMTVPGWNSFLKALFIDFIVVVLGQTNLSCKLVTGLVTIEKFGTKGVLPDRICVIRVMGR
jgi:hypothetical protein